MLIEAIADWNRLQWRRKLHFLLFKHTPLKMPQKCDRIWDDEHDVSWDERPISQITVSSRNHFLRRIIRWTAPSIAMIGPSPALRGSWYTGILFNSVQVRVQRLLSLCYDPTTREINYALFSSCVYLPETWCKHTAGGDARFVRQFRSFLRFRLVNALHNVCSVFP